MDWTKAVLLCVAGALLCSVLRTQRPEMAMALAIGTGLVALGMMLPSIRGVMDSVRSLWTQAGGERIEVIVKATGIALVCEFSSELCRDAGENALASRALMAGRVAVFSLAVPVVLRVMRQIWELLSAFSQ